MPQHPARKKPFYISFLIFLLVLFFMAALMFAAIVLYGHYYTQWEESHDIAFDLERWHNGSRAMVNQHQEARYRISMYRDFIARQPWRGKTIVQLEAWLGKPDHFPFPDGWDFNYWLGPQRGPLKVDSAWLCFKFDADGKAIDARMLQD